MYKLHITQQAEASVSVEYLVDRHGEIDKIERDEQVGSTIILFFFFFFLSLIQVSLTTGARKWAKVSWGSAI